MSTMGSLATLPPLIPVLWSVKGSWSPLSSQVLLSLLVAMHSRTARPRPWSVPAWGLIVRSVLGGRFKKEIVVDGQSYLLLIRDEGGPPELQVMLLPPPRPLTPPFPKDLADAWQSCVCAEGCGACLRTSEGGNPARSP